MAEFYGREGSFQDFYLELPTQKVVDRDLSEAKLQVEAMKEIALTQKGYDKDYLDALSRKYKVQNKNLQANFKLKQENYDDIFKASQDNAQREFEAIQKAQGNPGPKEASGWGDLVKLAPKLGAMVGEYIQKEKEWRWNTITDFVTTTGVKASDISRWAEEKELLLANSLETQQFVKAESERFGVQLTPQKMLEVTTRTGEDAIIQQEALQQNALKGYGVYLAGNGDTQIVLSDGTETTWAEMQSPHISGENFLEALRFMKGKFLQENDINILTVPIGPLGSLTEKMLKVEDEVLGRWSRAKNQQTAIQQQNNVTTQHINSIEAGGPAVLANVVRRAEIRGPKGKPDFTGAWGELTSVLRSGILNGTTQSSEVEAIIKARGVEKGGPIMQELRGILADARAKEADVTYQNIKNRKAASAQLREQYIEVFRDKWGLKPRGSIEQIRAQMLGQGMSQDDVKEALSVFTSNVNKDGGLGSNSKDKGAKGTYDSGLETTVDTIGNLVGGDNSGLIDHSKIIGWSDVKNDVTNIYREYYNRKWDATIGTTQEKAEAAAQYARDEVVRQYKDNPGLTAISADTKTNSKGEEVKLTDEERTFKRYSFGTNRGTSFDGASSKLARLKDTAGVSPTDRVLSMSKPEDAILDKSDVDRYVDSNGNISLRSFRADPLVKEIVKQTNVPASDLYQRHAELYGLPTLSDPRHFSYEELQQSLSKVGKRVNIHQSNVSSEVVHEYIQPSGNPASYTGFQKMSNVTYSNIHPEGAWRNLGASGPYGDILNFIQSVEAVGGYDVLNTVGSTPGLDQMTIAEAHGVAMNSRGSGAMGAYQQMPGYLFNRAKSIGLDPNTDLFNKENQEKLAILLINGSGYNAWMNGQLPTSTFANRLAGQWRGLPAGSHNKTYQDQYSGANKAGESWDRFIQMLEAHKHVKTQPKQEQPQELEPVPTKATPEIKSILNLWGLINDKFL